MTGALDNVKLNFIDNLDDVYRFINWFRKRGDLAEISVDTETSGFRYNGRDYVRLVQVGDDVTGWALDWSRWGPGLFDATVRHHRGPVNMMNAKFDWAFLRKAGVTLDQSRIHDVGVMAHINEPHMSRALKNQARRHIDPAAGGLQSTLDATMYENGWTWETIPTDVPPYWAYAALDTVLTSRLAAHHLPTVQARAPRAYEVETAFQWVALNMETYGAHVDVDYARKHREKFETYCRDVESWTVTEYGVKPGSNAAVVEVLSRAGFEFSKATKSGAVSLDAEVLEGIEHPLAEAVLRRRQLQKIASTYLRHYVYNVDGNSLIHPTINTLGTRTSRTSMEDPNLQNLPVRGGNPGTKVARNCITARPGNWLLFCDFDQLQMRLLAALCRDPGLIAAFAAPDDFFVTIARNIFSDPTLVKSDPRRQPTKNAMYAKIFGAGIAKQALTAGVSFDQMKFVNQALNLSYPGIESYARRIFAEGMAAKTLEGTAYATCELSGRRHPADPGKEYALVNYLIQGAEAYLVKLKLLELDAAGLGAYMVAPIHDEIILDVPRPEVADAVQVLRKVMNDDTMLPVPITASVSHGYRWGEKQEINESGEVVFT